MDEIGPVDYAVIAFPGNEFKGEIAPALADLVKAGTIRLIDAAFVGKDENGDIFTLETTDLAPDVQKKLSSLNIEVQGLLNDEELWPSASSSSSIPRRRSSSGRTSGPARSRRRCATQVAFWSRSIASRTTPSRQRANGRCRTTTPNTSRRTQMRGRRGLGRRGPGLLGTAVVVGGAAHMGAKSAQRNQAAAQQEADQDAQIADLQAQQTAPAPQQAAPAESDDIAELKKYAALKDQGIITEEEFAAKKSQILGI